MDSLYRKLKIAYIRKGGSWEDDADEDVNPEGLDSRIAGIQEAERKKQEDAARLLFQRAAEEEEARKRVIQAEQEKQRQEAIKLNDRFMEIVKGKNVREDSFDVIMEWLAKAKNKTTNEAVVDFLTSHFASSIHYDDSIEIEQVPTSERGEFNTSVERAKNSKDEGADLIYLAVLFRLSSAVESANFSYTRYKNSTVEEVNVDAGYAGSAKVKMLIPHFVKFRLRINRNSDDRTFTGHLSNILKQVRAKHRSENVPMITYAINMVERLPRRR